MATTIYTQGQTWQMGIAVDLKNHRFAKGRRYSSVLGANITGDLDDAYNQLTVNTEAILSLDDIAQLGDRLLIGPSSEASANATREEFVILASEANKEASPHPSTGTLYLRFPDNKVDYNSADAYIIKGTGLAAGWFIPISYYTKFKAEGIREGLIQLGYRGKVADRAGSVIDTFSYGGNSYVDIRISGLEDDEYVLGVYYNDTYIGYDYSTCNPIIGLTETIIELTEIVDAHSNTNTATIRCKVVGSWNIDDGALVNVLIGSTHGGGYKKAYAQRLSIKYGPSSGESNIGRLGQYLLTAGLDKGLRGQLTDPWRYCMLVPNAYYRVSVVYKIVCLESDIDINANNTYLIAGIAHGAPDGGQNYLYPTIPIGVEGTYLESTWLKYTSDPLEIRRWSTKVGLPYFFLQLAARSTGANPTDHSRLVLYIDRVVLEHSSGFTYPSDGCFDFERYETYPAQNSVNWEIISTEGTSTARSNAQSEIEPGENLYQVSTKFNNVSQEFWDEMGKLLAWQARGHLLTLHPFIDDLPHVLVGKVSVRGMVKDFWDLSKRSFELVFTEE